MVARPIHQLLGALGAEGAFGVLWSEELLEELYDVLTRPKPGRGWEPGAATAAAGYVRKYFFGGEVPAGALAQQRGAAGQLVRDEGDAHVVALALAGSAGRIVTANIKDYKVADLARRGVDVITPDAFLIGLYEDLPDDVVAALEDQVTGSERYPATDYDVLSLLYRAGCPRFAEKVCAVLGLPPPDPLRHGGARE